MKAVILILVPLLILLGCEGTDASLKTLSLDTEASPVAESVAKPGAETTTSRMTPTVTPTTSATPEGWTWDLGVLFTEEQLQKYDRLDVHLNLNIWFTFQNKVFGHRDYGSRRTMLDTLTMECTTSYHCWFDDGRRTNGNFVVKVWERASQRERRQRNVSQDLKGLGTDLTFSEWVDLYGPSIRIETYLETLDKHINERLGDGRPIGDYGDDAWDADKQGISDHYDRLWGP